MDDLPSYQCSGCHKRFCADGFKVNRLGCRNKTCLECGVRGLARARANKCEHGRNKYQCIDCGTGHCTHGKITSKCRYCNECDHGRCRSRCPVCSGHIRTPVDRCEHGRTTIQCRDCGTGHCEHGKITHQCVACKPERYIHKVLTKRISRVLTTEQRSGRTITDLLGCSISELIEYLQPQLDELGVGWADYVDKWVLDYRLQMGQDDDGKYRKGWQDETGHWVKATLEQSVKRLHHTNLAPKMSDPDWARGVRHGRNYLDDDELDAVLAEFGF